MLLRKQLPAFRTVTAGKDNLCQLNEGIQYDIIWLRISETNGTTLASGNLINDIVVKLLDNEQWRLTGKQLAAELAKHGTEYGIQTSGQPGTAGYTTYIPLPFTMPWFQPRAAGRAFALNAVAGSSPQLIVNLNSALVSPSLDGFFHYAPLAANASIGAITKFTRQTLPVSGTSNEHTTFAGISAKGDFIQGITLYPNTTSYVNKVKFTRNRQTIIDDVQIDQNQIGLMTRGWNPDLSASPAYQIMFDEENEQDPGLITAGANEMTLKAYYAATQSGTIDSIVELLGQPN